MTTFVGRTAELTELLRNLREGRHTLLVGEKGIGKSELILQAMGIFSGKITRPDLPQEILRRPPGISPGNLHGDPPSRSGARLRLITRVTPMGDFLREIAQALHGDWELEIPQHLSRSIPWDDLKRWFTSLGRAGQEEAILRSLANAGGGYILCLDSLDRITATHQAFLERLLSRATLCAATVKLKEGYHLKKVWASFARIDIGPLLEEESLALIRQLITGEGVRVADQALYEREIFKAAGGNPFHIRNLIWHGGRQRHLGLSDIRSLRRREEGELFNMGPLYIFGASGFTLFKIFSLGMGNREFYIYFSALGFLVYLVFRVFRTFFLFRPQRWGQ